MPANPPTRDVIVPCQSGRHRVRLRSGRRFWRSARCPICKAPVDPSRIRRLLRWTANLRHPASRAWFHRVLWLGVAANLALATAAAVALWSLSDRWWPATVLLFGPRWVLLLPLTVLLPGALALDRSLLLPVLLSGLVVAGPVMGVQTGLGVFLTPHQSAGHVRLASLNARGGNTLFTSPANLLAEWGVDVAAFQECGTDLRAALAELQGWHTDARSGLCLASRFPITDVEEMDREALQFAGGSGLVVTYTLSIDGNPTLLTNLHLETPRAGFELIRAGRLPEGIRKTREKSLLRDVELRRARIWVDRYEGPHVVLGDFNTPPESRSFRRAWGDWANAFSIAGWGLGGTRLNGWIRARIDHILTDDAWGVVRSWVGEDVGSDHLPIFAELAPRGGRLTSVRAPGP